MKFSCEKVLLQNAVTVASRAVAQKSTIPALEGVLLQADGLLTVSGNNIQTGIRTRVPVEISQSGEIVLGARLFGDILRKLPDDVVVFSSDEKQTVHLSCGDANFNIIGFSAADYPELPEVESEFSGAIQQTVLRQMIDETVFAVSTNDNRPVQTGVQFEIDEKGLTMAAVDGYRIAIRQESMEKIEGGGFSFVAPGSALNEVEKICEDTDKPVTFSLGKRHILFEIGDTELICRRLEGDFLNFRASIHREKATVVEVERKALIESIDRVSVVISEKQRSSLFCVFDHDKIFLSAVTGNGEANDVCRSGGDGNMLELAFNNRLLLEILRHIPAEQVRIELNGSASGVLLVPTDCSEKFLYMILPVRHAGSFANRGGEQG